MERTSSRSKQLTKNVILFTIGSVGTKLLAFFLVRLYTDMMTKTEYGTLDLITTIVSIAFPVLSFAVDSTVFRFCLDKKYDHSTVITNSSIMWGRALLLNLLLVVPLYLLAPVFKVENVHLFVIGYLLIFFCVGTNEFINSICRGLDRVGLTTIGSLIYTALFMTSNIVLLSVYRLGLMGYITSQVFASIVFLICMISMLKYPKYLKKNAGNKSIRTEMRKYGGPLIFNQIGWWINNSLDKYVVIFFLGLAENGIYSIAYKIPTILSIVGDVFANAWSISAIKEYKQKGSAEFASKAYEFYNVFLVLICGALLIVNYPIASFLFLKEFFIAWKMTGILLIATVFSGLSGFVGVFFSAAKDTKQYSISTILGGIVNISLSIILVQFLGSRGVAIGTLISYYFIYVYRCVKVKKYIKLDIKHIRNHCVYVLLLISTIVGMAGFGSYYSLIQIGIYIVIVIVYYKEIASLIRYSFNFIRHIKAKPEEEKNAD